jgi:hypothetical protein
MRDATDLHPDVASGWCGVRMRERALVPVSYRPSSRIRTLGGSLRVDLVTVEVAEHFERRGVPYLLLKGPSIATWLYEPGERGYGDSDFLVPPDQVDRASRILSEVGFRPPVDGGWNSEVADGAWTRPQTGSAIDLHARIWGPRASPELVWREALRTAEIFTVLDCALLVMSIPARALHIAMHAAQHVALPKQVREDLARVVRRDDVDWSAVADLAERWDAQAALAAGLSLDPKGVEVLRSLDLGSATDLEVSLRLQDAPALAVHLAEVRRRRGNHAPVKSLLRRLFPSAEYMRKRYALPANGRLRLAIAYLERCRDAFIQAGPAVLSLVKAAVQQRPR